MGRLVASVGGWQWIMLGWVGAIIHDFESPEDSASAALNRPCVHVLTKVVRVCGRHELRSLKSTVRWRSDWHNGCDQNSKHRNWPQA